MSNPLFRQLQNQNNSSNDFFQRFNQFQKMFNGNPQQQIQQLMTSGRITQQQYNNAYQMAQNLWKMFGK